MKQQLINALNELAGTSMYVDSSGRWVSADDVRKTVEKVQNLTVLVNALIQNIEQLEAEALTKALTPEVEPTSHKKIKTSSKATK